jgi:hypothetical protein
LPSQERLGCAVAAAEKVGGLGDIANIRRATKNAKARDAAAVAEPPMLSPRRTRLLRGSNRIASSRSWLDANTGNAEVGGYFADINGIGASDSDCCCEHGPAARVATAV